MSKYPQIPGYTIKKQIGRGGMANVYLAVEDNLSRMVAVKVFIPERFSSPRQMKRFVKEAKISSRLTHPNIVTVYGLGKVGDLYFIVMEYLGESLKERIRREGRFHPEDALNILLRLGSALFYAHLQGFIHRDVKPDNIMFRKDGSPVLVDFGIARAIETNTKLTDTGGFLGTPSYMSPEQCLGKKLDGRSDLYSLGIVFYEMLTGKTPYKNPDMRTVAMMHLQGEIPRLPFSVRRCQTLLEKMLAKKTRQRIGSEREFMQLIKPLLSPLETRPVQVSKSRRTRFPSAGEATLTSAGKISMKTGKTGESVQKRATRVTSSSAKKRKLKKKRHPLLRFFLFIILLIVIYFLARACGFLPLGDPRFPQ